MAMNPRLLRPTASGFDPRRIASLFQWYDGSDRATMFDATTGGAAVADDGTVARWEDKSGKGYHLTQGVSGNRPTLRGAIRNGRSVLEYDGANSNLVSASVSESLDALSVFAVFSADTLGQNSLAVLWSNNGLGNQLRQVRTQATSHLAFVAGSTDSRDANANYSFSSFTRYHSFWSGGTNRATDFSFLFNGSAVTPSTTGTTTVAATTAATTSVGNRPSGSRSWDGYIAEILVYNRLLSSSERVAVDRYLSGKWGF